MSTELDTNEARIAGTIRFAPTLSKTKGATQQSVTTVSINVRGTKGGKPHMSSIDLVAYGLVADGLVKEAVEGSRFEFTGDIVEDRWVQRGLENGEAWKSKVKIHINSYKVLAPAPGF